MRTELRTALRRVPTDLRRSWWNFAFAWAEGIADAEQPQFACVELADGRWALSVFCPAGSFCGVF